MIQILDAQRDPTSEPSQEVIILTVTGSSGGEVTAKIELGGQELPVSIISQGTTEIKIREIPFALGSYDITLTQDGTDSNVFTYVVAENKFQGTIPIPYAMRLNHSKNKNYLIHSNDIKGGTHCYPNIYYLLFLPKEKMLYGMQAVVHFPEEQLSRTYVLDGTQDFDAMPYPLSNSDAGISGSFRNYWKLLSESSYENEYLVDVQYAPDFKGGMPPYYENPDTLSRYTFPEGTEWDEERTFTANEWKAVRTQAHKWKRVKDKQSSEWSIPFLIDAAAGSFIQENRFVRAFLQPDDENQTSIKIPSFFKGESNKFAKFSMWGNDYYFYDVPPAKYTSFNDLDDQAKAKYEEIHGTVTDPTDATVLTNINKLWMTLASKDVNGNLKSGWTEPAEIKDGDGNLARYSVDGGGDINKVRQYIIDNAITDETQIDYLYNEAGWEANYRFGGHNYGAFRNDSSEPWAVRKIANESGQFTKDFYKPYPISYYNQITNVTTKGNFLPIGKSAENNPEDPIQEYAWTDGIPAVIPEGYELWRAFTVLSNDESQQIGDYNMALVSGRIPVDVFASKDHEYFETTEEITDDGQTPVITRKFDWINVEAKAMYDGKNLHELSYNTSGGAVKEQLTYKWERIYNAGQADTLIIFNNYPEETPVTPPDGFTIANSGRNLGTRHDQVDSSAVFKCTIYRKVDLLDEFEGTDIKWLPYTFEFSLWDQRDKIIRGISVSPEANNFLVDGNASYPLTADNYIGRTAINIRAFASNVSTQGAWYKWNHTAGNFDNFRGNTAVEASKDSQYWIDLNDNNMVRGVLWNADEFHDTPDRNYNVYKYQSSVTNSDNSTTEIFDYVTIFKNNTGANAIDVKLAPESVIVAMDDTGTSFTGDTRKFFFGTTQNVDNPTYNWKLRDKSGNLLVSLENVTKDNFVFEANHAITDVGFDYRPDSVQDFVDRSPYRLMCRNVESDLWEESILAAAFGGGMGIKGDKGDDGASGVAVIYDSNDLVPTEVDGTPIGTVDESTSVMVMYGNKAASGGAGSGEFTVRLWHNGSEVTSIDEGGLIVNVENHLTIRVTGIPTNTDPKVALQFRVYENNANPIIDASGATVNFNYKLVKSFKGQNALEMFLSNEAQIYNVDGQGNLISHTIDSVSNCLAKSQPFVSSGGVISTIPDGATIGFAMDGVDMVAVNQGSYQKFRLPTDSNNFDDTHVWYHTTNKVFYIVDKGNALPPEQFTIEFKYSGMVKAMTMNRVEAPQDLKTIQMIPVSGNFAPADRKSTFQFDFQIRYFIGNAETQTAFGDLKLYINGVETAGTTYDNNKGIRFPATAFEGTAVATVISDATYVGAYTVYDLYDNSKSIPMYGGLNNKSADDFDSLSDIPGFPPNQICYHSNGSVYYIDYDQPRTDGGYVTYEVRSGSVIEDNTSNLVSFRGGTGSDRDLGFLANGTVSSGSTWMTTDLSKLTISSEFRTVLFMSSGKPTGNLITLPNGKTIREYTFIDFYAVRGEKGEKGRDIRNVPIYYSGQDDVRPVTPSGTLIPSGWSMDPSTTGIIWVSERSFEYVGKGNGTVPTGDTSSPHYKAYNAISGLDSWSTPTRLSGYEGVTVVRLYAKSSTTTSPTKPADTVGPEGNSTWKADVSDLAATASQYVFEVKRNYQSDVAKTSWIGPYLWRAGQLTGAKGEKGDTGETGPRPNHQWSGTSLRFQNPDGSYSSYVNLQGQKGDTGLIDGGKSIKRITSFTKSGDYLRGTLGSSSSSRTFAVFGHVASYIRKNRHGDIRLSGGTYSGRTGSVMEGGRAISLPDGDAATGSNFAFAGVLTVNANSGYIWININGISSGEYSLSTAHITLIELS